MSFERMKSIVLLILVFISAYLTWQIWTYQPTLKRTDQSEYFKVLSDTKSIADVVKPKNALFHVGERHFQINDEEKMNNIQSAFLNWSLYSFEKVNETEFLNIQSKANTEINFADQIPFKLYKSVFNVEMNEVPEFSFDKIIFTSADSNMEEAKIYFISTENKTVIQTIVNGESIRTFYEIYYKHANEYPECIKYQVSKRKEIYVLKDPAPMKQSSYQLGYRKSIMNNFKYALFSDPTSVRQEYVSNVEEFTDGTRLLSVDRNSSMINFINPSQKRKVVSSTSDLLQQSIDFVNDHAGWDTGDHTGEYESSFRFSELWQGERRVVFRLFVKGLPVFNEVGMAEIEQVWGNEEIFQYRRPYFYLDLLYPAEEPAELLPSGEEAVTALKNIRNFNPEVLEDLEIGYQMTKPTPDSKSVILKPAWYYQYGGTWIILPFEQKGEDR
ncbi:YycH family regulatory protein [Peribacillus loiseleuriae]|uniref:Regulatory protein YycH domain-containing protein n=1 Tax=Peribacillus loiseleuriae TaxID=1679170 RepID=A0A0K9GZW0_9BACI|nr:two-component system activity regulator YycH [Peribacillus loiseleuriae]KMY52120.1 hypothetical protein AC625_23515 [Peribacillus loiseleuriae]